MIEDINTNGRIITAVDLDLRVRSDVNPYNISAYISFDEGTTWEDVKTFTTVAGAWTDLTQTWSSLEKKAIQNGVFYIKFF